MKALENIYYRLWLLFKVYLPYQYNVFINYISTKNRTVHGAMTYKCDKCGREWRMWLETGVGGNDGLMTMPFTIGCFCGDIAKHIDWHKDVHLPHSIPLGDKMNFFMLDRRGLKKKKLQIYGLPILRK